MKQRFAELVWTFALTLLAVGTYARVTLPAIISSNMVLQRDAKVSIWGWADAGEKVMIRASWLKSPLQVRVDGNGNWAVVVNTTNSKEPQSMWIHGANQDISLKNILFGEVWLCSGQSNMDIPIKGYIGQPVYGAQDAIASPANDNLRFFTVGDQAGLSPIKELGAHKGWESAAPESVKEFSAVAYYFGKQLQEMLGVPVGLIQATWGGSLIEAWMSKEALGSVKEFDLNGVDLKRGNRFPTVLFNAMINPLIPYNIRGAIWYQGEANLGQPKLYKLLFPAMVRDWRKRWGIGDFPFYYVQIAPFAYSERNRMDDPDNAAFMREAQLQCLDSIPNSGLAVTLDVGTEHVIHPPDKRTVAKRLVCNALAKTYGLKGVEFSGPVFDSAYPRDGGMYLSFKHPENGLYAFGKLEGFEIAGADRVFYAADAFIYEDNKLFVKNDRVNEPVAVRYAWRSWTKGTLFDDYLLPASSFRTDNWDDARQSEQK